MSRKQSHLKEEEEHSVYANALVGDGRLSIGQIWTIVTHWNAKQAVAA